MFVFPSQVINNAYIYHHIYRGQLAQYGVLFFSDNDFVIMCMCWSSSTFYKNPSDTTLAHWGWVTHTYLGNLSIIGSDNGLSPVQRQAIIWMLEYC